MHSHSNINSSKKALVTCLHDCSTAVAPLLLLHLYRFYVDSLSIIIHLISTASTFQKKFTKQLQVDKRSG